MKNNAKNEKCVYSNDDFFKGQFSIFLKNVSQTDFFVQKTTVFEEKKLMFLIE